MKRPAEQPLTRLPVLEERRAELERCVFCPKLCRSACPVSNEEPRETLIPWGKMSSAYLLARGDLPLEREVAYPPWACTGCFACRDACDHKNDVAGTLLRARSAIAHHGAAPAAAMRVIHEFTRHDSEVHERALALGRGVGGPETLLVGCAYLKLAEGEHVYRATAALLGHAPRVLGSCCGLPLLLAGDRAGFARSAARVARDADELIVGDPGCALAVIQRYPEVEVKPPRVRLLIEMAAAAELRAIPAEPARYHEPCQLGRGLGVREAPRAILRKVRGEVQDLPALCSGGGGLLPVTMPETARGIARTLAESTRETIVTACASSLLQLRRAGARAEDLALIMAQGLGVA